jgi:hypothetical protein
VHAHDDGGVGLDLTEGAQLHLLGEAGHDAPALGAQRERGLADPRDEQEEHGRHGERRERGEQRERQQIAAQRRHRRAGRRRGHGLTLAQQVTRHQEPGPRRDEHDEQGEEYRARGDGRDGDEREESQEGDVASVAQGAACVELHQEQEHEQVTEGVEHGRRHGQDLHHQPGRRQRHDDHA